jgi:hypothetical protein
MDELRAKYEKQVKDYDALVVNSIETNDVSQVSKLRQMNAAIANTLNSMIETLTFLKKDTPSIKKERDELLTRLTQIQLDYNGLKVNTDQLETLRRIRQQENSEVNRELYMYLGFFFVVCLILLLFLMFMPQRKDTTAASASIPPTAAALV